MRPTRTVLAQRVPKTVFRIPHPRTRTKENNPNGLFSVLAEDVGFEPTRTFLLWRFSKPLPSATRPILQYFRFAQIVALREDWPCVYHAALCLR